MKRIPIKVTDHAVMRYMQRVMGVDLDAVKTMIAEQVHVAETNEGATAVLLNGFRYVIDKGTVVTIHKIGHGKASNATRVKDRPQ